MGLKCIEWLFAIGRALGWLGRRIAAGSVGPGGRFVRLLIPLYRLWWTMRRVGVHGRLRGTEAAVRLLTSRLVLQSIFAVVVLGIAMQTIHAREFGGFIGKRALLSTFITSEEEDLTEEIVEGPALPTQRPTFRAASVSTALQPTVLAAEAVADTPPSTTGFALIQPILTDAAVEETGRAGIQTYIVEPGDTPSTIAERFGLSTSTILWENALSAWSMIRPGDALRILPTDGVSYTVRRGDTLEAIAKRFGAEAEEILEFNRLVDADDIDVGDLLIIPGGRPPAIVAPPVIRRPTRPALPLPSISGKFLWPSEGGYRISQYFTWRHHGVDIAVAHGTTVFASEVGTVVSSGWIRGYGYQVLIDHGNGLQTRYGHNSKLLVVKGQRVDRGQPIALVGSTGRSTGPHIHYEVFANGARVNPFRYLR
ncbi:peptidoglycan DD-metalloendopeptidase family protein [Candidatus Uhrbacteria bacterium]|nr:peptidoglycan DD-metalloendopeptidase family protein [Candidatus Uhrbacteria bacterium]